MPNTPKGGGISRKIFNPADRKKIRNILNQITIPKEMGIIVRTAGAIKTKNEGDYTPKKTSSLERVFNRCFTSVLFLGKDEIEPTFLKDQNFSNPLKNLYYNYILKENHGKIVFPTRHTREKQQDKNRRDRELDRARLQTARQKNTQTTVENAPSLAVLKKKIKSGTKLGSTETSSAKARGLIPRADGTKRKSPKYK